MKRKLIILLILLSGTTLFAQWQQCPLYGGSVKSLLANGTNVFAGTPIGVYKTIDYGQNWIPVNSGLPSIRKVHCIAERGGEIFIGVDWLGIYKSTDYGVSWSAANTGLPISNCTPKSIIFVGTDFYISMSDGAGGVYKSTDYGNSWFPVINGLDNINITCLAYDSTGIYAGCFWYGGIYKTTDNGTNWYPTNSGFPSDTITINTIVIKDTVIYTGLSTFNNDNYIYKSTDDGANWTFCADLGYSINKLAVCGNRIFAGTENGAYYSTDGINWTAINSGLINKSITTFAVNGLDIFAGTRGGVYLLSENDTCWTPVNNGMSTFTIKSFANIGNHLFASEQNNGVFSTSDYGNTWTLKKNGIPDDGVVTIGTNGAILYTGNHYGFYRSLNYANFWEQVYTGLPWGYAPDCIIARDSNVFFGAPLGVFKSVDNGLSWSVSNNGLSSLSVRSMALSNSGDIYAAVYNVGAFMSTNSGANWTNINNGFPGLDFINSITTCDDFVFAGLGNYNPPVVTSNDYGVTWKIGTNGLFGHEVKTLKTIGNSVFAGLNDGVFYTNNNGDVWLDVSMGLPLCEITSIGRDDSCVYVGTLGCGVWKRSLNDFVIDFTDNKTVDLSQPPKVFPNPFHTYINTSCTKEGSLTIMDYTGRPVLIKLFQSGENTFNTLGLPPGLYFLKLQQGDKVFTYKVVKEP